MKKSIFLLIILLEVSFAKLPANIDQSVEIVLQAFSGNNQEFLVSGNAFLDEFPFTYSWNKEHGVTLNDESIVNGTLTLSRESFKALNVEIPNEMMIGEANADFKITLKKKFYVRIW